MVYVRYVLVIMQNKKISNTKKQPESVSICPNELKCLMKSVNFLPNDLKRFENDLMDLSLQFNDEFYGAKAPLETIILGLLQKYCEKIRSMVSPQMDAKISELLERNDFQNVLFQLHRLINEKITLKTVIQAFETSKEYNNPNQTFVFDKSIAAFSFSEDSSLEIASFRVIEILTRKKLPIDRIRICPVCKNIFWAKRTESPACSAPHVHTFNTRKTRIKKDEEEFKEQVATLKKLAVEYNSQEHPLVLDQLKKVKNLQNKIQKKAQKYGIIQTPEQ